MLWVVLEKIENKINLVLALFTLNNDTIQAPSDIETTMDFHAMVHGLLDSWVQRQKIIRFTSLEPNNKTLEGISDLLGKWKLPSRNQIRKLFTENIGKSKVLIWLVGTIITSLVLLFLDRIVGLFWH